MCAVKQDARPRSLAGSIVSNRCPRCREGRLFTNPNPYDLKTTMRMPQHCPVCEQPFELQTGFYFGTGYVSYFLSVFIMMVTFVLWYFTIGFSLTDNRLFWYLGTVSAFLLITQPIQQRLCRSIWIACFVRYNQDWKRLRPAAHASGIAMETALPYEVGSML